jgi:transcriptional regulator NrdR family protein
MIINMARSKGPGFACPSCGGRTDVINSGAVRKSLMPGVKRRRSCLCGYRVTTYEFPKDNIFLTQILKEVKKIDESSRKLINMTTYKNQDDD